MAVAARKSGPITNRDATPRVMNNAGVMGGEVRAFSGTVESVSGDDIGSTYIFAQVPSNCFVKKLALYSDDNGTTATADVGIYRTTEDGSAVVDADFFASAVDIHSGALNGTDILHESTAFDPDDVEKPLWQALGLSSDPGVMYDVVMTLTAASDAAATISLEGLYAL